MDNILISQRIKDKCKDKSISISKLIEECSLSKSFIYDLEKRGTSPSIDKISAIANYFDCSIDYLIGKTDNPNVNK